VAALADRLLEREQDGRIVVDDEHPAHDGAPTGSAIVAVVPAPGVLVYSSVPRCCAIADRAITTPIRCRYRAS